MPAAASGSPFPEIMPRSKAGRRIESCRVLRGITVPDHTDAGSTYNAATELIDAAVARGFGNKVAFCDGARSLTYGQLRERTWRVAAAFASLGFKPESRIALLLPDSVDFP